MSDGEVLALCESPACRPLRMLNKKLSWTIRPYFILLLLQLPKHPTLSLTRAVLFSPFLGVLLPKLAFVLWGCFWLYYILLKEV